MISLTGKRKADSEADSNVEKDTLSKRQISFHSTLFHQQPPTFSRIFDLPEAVLLIIFEVWLNLEDIARFDSAVCNDRDRGLLMSLLRRLAYKHAINLFRREDTATWLLLRKIGLESIHIRESLSNEKIEKFPLKWSVIKKITITGSNSYKTLERCDNLEVLEYQTTYYQDNVANRAINNKILANVFDSCHEWDDKLKTLKFHSKVLCSDHFVKSITVKFPQLVHLRISLDGCSHDTLSALFTNCTQLRSLCINSLPITNPGSIAMKPHKNLRELHIQEISGSDCLVQQMFQNFSNLENLLVSLSPCSDQTLLALFTTCVHLKNLTIYNLPYHNRVPTMMRPNLNLIYLYLSCEIDKGISVSIGRCYPNLRTLKLFICGLDDPGIIAIAEGCRQLVNLELSEDTDECNIHDQSLAMLLENCTQLETLSLSALKSLTDLTYTNITRYCRNLKYLTLNNELIDCSNTTPFTNIFVCLKLTHIECTGSYLTDVVLHMLLQSCPNLKFLSLTECDNITEVALYHIANHCRNLTRLTLCQLNISGNSRYVDQIFKCNTKLRRENVEMTLPTLS